MLLFLDLEAEACEAIAMSSVMSRSGAGREGMEEISGVKKVEEATAENIKESNQASAVSEAAFDSEKATETMSGTKQVSDNVAGMKEVSDNVRGMKEATDAVLRAEKVTKIAAISVKTKVVIGVVAAALTIAGVGAAIAGNQNPAEPAENTVVEVQTEEAEATEQQETVSDEENTGEQKDSTQQEEVKESKSDALPISGEYLMYGKGNQGLIPVCGDNGKYGLVTYDNEIVVPFEYDYACQKVNDEGQSFFKNDAGSYVFDREGNQLFFTERNIQSVKDGVIFVMEGRDFDANFAYYNIDGTVLYESEAEGEDKGAAAFNEGYAFFSDWGTSRLSADGTEDSVTDLVYGDQLAAQREQTNDNSSGIIVDSIGMSFVLEIPISPLNQGFYMSRGILGSSDSYGIYTLRSMDASTSYDFDFSSIFNRRGLSFTRSGAGWGLQNYFDDGCTYSNYGTLICPYINIDGERMYYLIDTAKVVPNSVEYVNPGEYWSDEDYWDYDYILLTDEALLFEAENIVMSNESYWLVKKDGQWGYIDHAGNVMGMYEDATEFSNGKAIVIENGNAYVIDESFAKTKDLGPALSVTNYGEVFKVVTEDELMGKMIKVD